MAGIGLRLLVGAQIDTEVAGQRPTYKAGMVLGQLMQANLSITRNDNPLNADDVEIDNDNGVSEMSLEVGIADLENDASAYIGLEKKVAGTTGSNTAPDTYHITGGASNDMGIGYMRVKRKKVDGKPKYYYDAVWMHKGQFGMTQDNATTKGRNIEWQTPTITANIFGVDIQEIDPDELSFRERATFETAAAAQAWLYSKANITASSGN